MDSRLKKGIIIVMTLACAAVACGCMISSGVFIGINRSYGNYYLRASYKSFDGSLARRVSLGAGDTVTFYCEGSGYLQPVVVRSGEVLFDITDGSEFCAPEGGSYDFTVRGKDKDGEGFLAAVNAIDGRIIY